MKIQDREERRKSGNRSQEGEGGRQEAGARRQVSGDRSQESEAIRQEAGDRSQKQGDATSEPRATDQDRRSGSRDAKDRHEESVEVQALASQPQASERPAPTTTSEPVLPPRNTENAGATGDVTENKGGLKTDGVKNGHSQAENSASTAPNKQVRAAAGGSMTA
jgi:hypothetical protein